MRWLRTTKFDPQCCALANRHYPAALGRRKIGAPQWLPPGDTIALRTVDGDAAWGSSLPRYRRDELAGQWINSFFRNENRENLSSELILEAIAATRDEWPELPTSGVFTFIDVDSVRRKRDPGRCYLRAGFEHYGYSKIFGRLILRLAPELIPPPAPALTLQLELAAT